MAEEKILKNEELTDKQVNEVSGGLISPDEGGEGLKKCASPGCTNMISDLPDAVFCDACLRRQRLRRFF